MKVYKTSFPVESILNQHKEKYDYTDSYQSEYVMEGKTITSTALGKSFFSTSPKWVQLLFSLRNKLVKLVGLKTSSDDLDREKQLETFKCEPGDQIGLFKVFAKTTNEVVLGEDDKHLNFRVSLLHQVNQSNKKTIIITTTVEFNNWFGRLYFLPVRPFHKVIVPVMLKQIMNVLVLD